MNFVLSDILEKNWVRNFYVFWKLEIQFPDSDKDVGARAKDQLLSRVTATMSKNGGKGGKESTNSKEVSVSRVY